MSITLGDEFSMVPSLIERMNTNSKSNFQLLQRAYKYRMVVPFVGSGLSANVSGTKFPQWKNFLVNYARQLGIEEKVSKILENNDIAFRYEKAAAEIAKNDAAFIERIQDAFTLDAKEIIDENATVQLLPKLFAQTVVLTTNLDTVLERVYQCAGVQFNQILYGMTFTKPQLERITTDLTSNRRHVLLKVHGCVNDKNTIVFSDNQYAKLYGTIDAKRSHMRNKFPKLFAELTRKVHFLFLGCSLEEDRYLEVLKQEKRQQKEETNYHFAILEAPDNENEFDSRQRYLTSCGIIPIWYSKGHYEEVRKYLEQLIHQVESRKTDKNDKPLMFVDEVAKATHEKHLDERLAKAIMTQYNIAKQSHRVKLPTIAELCKEIIDGNHRKCPLEIKGQPGTGKSTLLSLLYLNIPKPEEYYVGLIDLHLYDDSRSGFLHVHLPELSELLAQIENELKCHKENILFIDGIDGYVRVNKQRENQVREKIVEWGKKYNIHFVFAVGEMDSQQFPPFTREINPIPFAAGHIIELSSINANTKEFSFLTTTVLEVLSDTTVLGTQKRVSKSTQKSAFNALKDNIITYCKKLSGSMVEFRTVVFVVKNYQLYNDALFKMEIGKVLQEYICTFVDRKSISDLAKQITSFLLNKMCESQELTSSLVFKSPIFRDFFFAVYYLECVESENADIMRIFDCIFTPSINRFIVSLLGQNARRELIIVKSLTNTFESLGTKARAQAAYLLGRIKNTKAKSMAISFLRKQYRVFANQSRLQNNGDEDEMMLFRSIGISLIYLGDKEDEDDFFSLMIYNEAISVLNLKFHVAYYTTDAYKVGEYLNFADETLYTRDNLKNLYNFLYHSITTALDKGKQGINIITIISLTIYQKYQNGGDEEKHNLHSLIDSLATDTSITSPTLKKYILSIKDHLTEKNIYASALTKLYSMKTIQRSGWLEKGREIDKKARVESDADHTWGCCLLAQVLLDEKIENCIFLNQEDKIKYNESYNRDRIIQMLLVHDLPEVYTGDIPIDKQTSDKKDKENVAMQKIAALDAFPFFRSFHKIEQTWLDYEAGSDINSVLAYQIDKIEPLVQLFIYRDALPEGQRDNQFRLWVQKASEQISMCSIQTSFGNNVLAFISKYLLEGT